MDGKIVIETEKFTHVREIEGEEMIEVRWTSSTFRDMFMLYILWM